MAKKKEGPKKLNKRLAKGFARVIAEVEQAPTLEDGLDILARELNECRTLTKRGTALNSNYTPIAVKKMASSDIFVRMFSPRRMLRLDRIFQIPEGAEGQVIRDKLIEIYGKRFVNKLFPIKKTRVPARTVIKYPINEEMLGAMSEKDRVILWHNIGLEGTLYVGPKTQAAKENRPPKRR